MEHPGVSASCKALRPQVTSLGDSGGSPVGKSSKLSPVWHHFCLSQPRCLGRLKPPILAGSSPGKSDISSQMAGP